MSAFVNLDTRANTVDQLRAIDSMARSSASSTAGNIGMVNGKVVKFNTHFGERLFGKTTEEMREASTAMRKTLENLVGSLDLDDDVQDRLCAMINENPGKLLKRSVVVKVMDELQKLGNEVAHTKDELRADSSKGLKTDFATVVGDIKDSRPETTSETGSIRGGQDTSPTAKAAQSARLEIAKRAVFVHDIGLSDKLSKLGMDLTSIRAFRSALTVKCAERLAKDHTDEECLNKVKDSSLMMELQEFVEEEFEQKVKDRENELNVKK